MAHLTTPLRNPSHHPGGLRGLGFRDWIAGFGAGLSARAEEAMNRLSRADRVAGYEAMTDADLARMGLTRDGIVAHVFRDKFHL